MLDEVGAVAHLRGIKVVDIAQVEVLRGPQGTLFGRNTPAGVLKFDSAKPTKEFEGYLQGSYATFSTINVEGAASGPLTSTLSARFSALFQHRDNWVDNTFTGPGVSLGPFEAGPIKLSDLWVAGAGATISVLGIPF